MKMQLSLVWRTSCSLIATQQPFRAIQEWKLRRWLKLFKLNSCKWLRVSVVKSKHLLLQPSKAYPYQWVRVESGIVMVMIIMIRRKKRSRGEQEKIQEVVSLEPALTQHYLQNHSTSWHWNGRMEEALMLKGVPLQHLTLSLGLSLPHFPLI